MKIPTPFSHADIIFFLEGIFWHADQTCLLGRERVKRMWMEKMDGDAILI